MKIPMSIVQGQATPHVNAVMGCQQLTAAAPFWYLDVIAHGEANPRTVPVNAGDLSGC